MNHSRTQILNAARRQGEDIGDEAIIAYGEYGYHIGSIYVSKEDMDTEESESQHHQQHDAEPNKRSSLHYTHGPNIE